MVERICPSIGPSGLAAVGGAAEKASANILQRKTTSITIINTAMGINLAAVPIMFIAEACRVPRMTRKHISQITSDPPMIEYKLFPPVKVPGKK